jgi:hypothetical protein
MAYHSRLRAAQEKLKEAKEKGPSGPGSSAGPGPCSDKGPDFKTFFEDLGAAFQQAEKLMKAGLTQGELEAVKLSLRNAYADLGIAVGALWEEQPDARIGLSHPALEKAVAKICELQERVAELQAKVEELKR